MLLLAALVCYLGECLLPAVALSQLAMGQVLSPGMDAVPTWGPLGFVEPAALRLWIMVLSAIVLALGLRWVSRRLYADAIRRTEEVAGG